VKPIPVSAAKRIAKLYGYDQIVIIARKTGEVGGEHVTTYGINREHCAVAAATGDFLKYRIMGWRHDRDNDLDIDQHYNELALQAWRRRAWRAPRGKP
jgi:hypothetical protein